MALSRVYHQLSSTRKIGRLDGLVITSQMGEKSVTHQSLSSKRETGSQVATIEVGSDPRSWQDAVVEIAEQMEIWL